jgi:hypothetical protein
MRGVALTAIIALLAATAALALAGCGGDDGDETVTEVVTETQPGTVTGEGDAQQAQAALEGIVQRDLADPAYHIEGIRTDPAVSQEFVDLIDRITAEAKAQGAPALEFDPIVCAQQLPSDVSYSPQQPAGDRLTITGTLTYGGGPPQTVSYEMVREGEDWKLASTSCALGN